MLAKPINSPDTEYWHGLIALGVAGIIVVIILGVRSKWGIEAPDFQKNQVRELSRRHLSAGL